VLARRLRLLVGLWALAEVAVFILVAAWIGLGWTLLAALATTAVGWVLLARQGTRALADLRERARSGRPAGRALGDAGLVAVGGLLMVLPGFLGDLVGLLCLLPFTRGLVRGLIAGLVFPRLQDSALNRVRVTSVRTEEVLADDGAGGTVHVTSVRTEELGDRPRAPRVIEGEVDDRPDPTR
jgi:UPF0716 protein FxsA